MAVRCVKNLRYNKYHTIHFVHRIRINGFITFAGKVFFLSIYEDHSIETGLTCAGMTSSLVFCIVFYRVYNLWFVNPQNVDTKHRISLRWQNSVPYFEYSLNEGIIRIITHPTFTNRHCI